MFEKTALFPFLSKRSRRPFDEKGEKTISKRSRRPLHQVVEKKTISKLSSPFGKINLRGMHVTCATGSVLVAAPPFLPQGGALPLPRIRPTASGHYDAWRPPPLHPRKVSFSERRSAQTGKSKPGRVDASLSCCCCS